MRRLPSRENHRTTRLWAIGVFLANFTVWSRLSGAYVEFLEVPIALLCGFMYPLRILPEWMQSLAAIIPLRWGVEALDESLLGSHDLIFFLQRWGMTVLLAAVFWGLTRLLERTVHDRIRVSGEMRSI